MRPLFLGFALSALLLIGQAQALRLADGLYFTVLPNSSAEVYFILPDDVGAGPAKADYYITTETNWSVDLTEQLVTTEENNTVIIPIKFYSSGRKEGYCSNYTIRIYAPEINVSKKWSGGACLSKYMDADISRPGGDAKDVLNKNADLFDFGFRTNSKAAGPGEAAQIGIFVQSQASMTIDISLESEASLSQKSFSVQTGPGSQYLDLVLNASAASPGTYGIRGVAKARNCPLDSCEKQAAMDLVVSDSGPQEGFSVSLFPQNIAIKTIEPVPYKLTIQNNYREDKLFIAKIDKTLDVDTSLVVESVTVPALSERTVNFTATPRNYTGFYEIKAFVSMDDVEKVASAYLSTNEMVSDVYRSADEARAGANSSVRSDIDTKVRSWYSSYSKSDNLTEYKNLQDALDAARKPASDASNASVDEGTGEEPKPNANPLWMLAVPALLGGIVLVVLLLFRRKQQSEDGEVLESV